MESGAVIPVRVAVRVRPLSEKELSNGCKDLAHIIPGRPQIQLEQADKAFTFDYAFGQGSCQDDVYGTAVKPLVNQLFKGYNATVLAYGQTGSGKTHTMGTCANESTPLALEGIIPKAVREIFYRMGEMQDYMFSVRIAFIELYKEQLYDLLSAQAKKEDSSVDLREDPKMGVIIANLTEVPVNGLESTLKQLEVGSLKRVTAATAMNNVSSRSHAIFTLTIEGTRNSDNETDGGEEDENQPRSIIAKFHLVDLAGSERAKKTMATGVRYKEGVSINLGLLALGNVISALGEEGRQRGHIPYRDSKLTRLLQDSLGGNSYTLMIACVSPADTNLDETLSTLRYADRARKIKNKPIVNRDEKEKEISNLRRELAELRAQLGRGGGDVISRAVSFSNEDKEEFERLKERYSATVKENSELTMALVACQEEMSFMNEKLILNENASEMMKTKLKELAATTEAALERSDSKDELKQVLRVIMDIVSIQKAGEKSLIDHEVTRYDNQSSSNGNKSPKDDEDDSNDETEDHPNDQTFNVTHALKQNALASQIANLNKLLAHKEQLASTMDFNEEKIGELKKQYEDNIKSMESEMEALAKEKEHLQQQLRSEPASKIAEARRKRIQDLEHSIQDLRKKVTEQERIIKMNEKNALKVKQLADEIRQMKQQKVKLIKQMREDAENVRVWKQKKERELSKLKQNERKQQFQMARMENLHTKQQNVLRRKMEEAMAANKRLKDVVERQKAARKMSRDGDKQGLAGAADRMRNFVTQELDMVVSVKEATQSRFQLLEDRKTLTKQLNELKKKSRFTMVAAERDELAQKTEQLQAELDSRNDEIADLQKQILSADQDKEKDGGRNWWDTSVTTMTEAKIALQYLFEKAAENMVQCSASAKELQDLRFLYDEAVKNTTHLEGEINQMKLAHTEELDRASKDYEERVMILLSKLSNSGTEIKDSDIQKFSKLHEALLKMREESEEKQQTIKMNQPRAPKPARVIEDDLSELEEEDEEEESENDDDNEDDDPEWTKTPLFRRIKKLREANNTRLNVAPKAAKKRRTLQIQMNKDEEEEEDEDVSEQPPVKRFSNGNNGCSCKTGCKSLRCACKKSGQNCGEKCKCANELCLNKGVDSTFTVDNKTPLKEDIESADNTAGTMSLLNASFDGSLLVKREIDFSPNKKRAANENEPPNTMNKKPNLFKSPLR